MKPLFWVGFKILGVMRGIGFTAQEFVVSHHGFKMTAAFYLGNLYSAFIKKGSESITHGATKTEAWKHLSILIRFEPYFVDKRHVCACNRYRMSAIYRIFFDFGIFEGITERKCQYKYLL